jgi:capsular polysaccharide biosynthesis protein
MDLKGVPHLEGRIDDLVRTGQLDATEVKGRSVLTEAAVPPAAKLIPGTEGQNPPWIAGYHRGAPPQIAERVNCYVVRRLTISGIGYASIGGKQILTPEVIPDYWQRKLKEDWAGEPARLAALPIRRIKGRTVAFTGWGTDTYGHLLVEMLPRLLIARRALPGLADTKLLLPSNAPAWFEAIIRRVLAEAMPGVERYDPHREQVLLDKGVLPSLALQPNGFHPGLNGLMDEVRDAVTCGPQPSLAPRVFMTRALFSNPSTAKRRCQNEVRLAEIAAREYGFAVIAPETLPWDTQVRLMAGAAIVAGEFGSAMHGTIFSPAGTRVAVLGIQNMTQSRIADLRGHQIAYLPTDRPNALGNYAVDEWAFRRFMDAVAR